MTPFSKASGNSLDGDFFHRVLVRKPLRAKACLMLACDSLELSAYKCLYNIHGRKVEVAFVWTCPTRERQHLVIKGLLQGEACSSLAETLGPLRLAAFSIPQTLPRVWKPMKPIPISGGRLRPPAAPSPGAACPPD